MVKPLIFGCSGYTLTNEEKSFFQKHQPYGFIIFSRNIQNPEQLRKLNQELKDCVEHKAEILVDQEGGRVQRLTEPHWQKHPPASHYKTPEEARNAAYQIAKELLAEGFTVDCAPMLDVRAENADNIIGDRAFCSNPE